MSTHESKRARSEPGEPASASVVDEEGYAVRSADGVVLHWPRHAAERAGTLKNWIEEKSGEEETGDERAFPTPLTARVLETLRATCAHDGDEASSPLASLPLSQTIDVLGGANFLEAEGVSAAAARHLCGTLLAGKSVDELRSALVATDDLSADGQKAALREPLHTLPAGAGAGEEESASAAGTSSSAPPTMKRSLSTRAGNEDVLVTALQEADTLLLCRLKAVSRAWRVRARNELCRRVSRRGAGQLAPASLDAIAELDVELLSAAGREHEVAAAGRELPSLARLHGWGFVVDVQAVRQADLSHVLHDVAPPWSPRSPDPPAEAVLTTSPALRVCVTGEGEPPLELLLAAVACAASGEVLGVPVQQLREDGLVELDLSGRGVSVGGVRLLALLLPSCSKLVRLNLDENQLTNGGRNVSGILKLAEALPHSQLTSLSLALNVLGEGIVKVAEAVPHSQLTSLSIDRQSKSVLPIEELKGTKPVESIDLSGQALGASSAVIIASCIQENAVVKELNLDDNNLSVYGMEVWGIRHLAEALPHSQVTSLSLRRCELQRKAAAALAEGLEGNTTLRTLDLTGNCLVSLSTCLGPGENVSGLLKLAEALPHSKLTSLSLADCKLCAVCGDGSGGDYTAEGVNALCDALKSTTTLTSLNILKNQLGGSVDAVAAAARKLPQLTTLCGIKPEQEAVDFSGQDLGPDDAKLLALDLSRNKAVKSLTLDDNCLGGSYNFDKQRIVKDMSGILKLAKALPKSRLTALSLANNSLDEKAKQAIREASGGKKIELAL